MKIYISAPRSRAHKKNTVVLILRHIQCLMSIIDIFAVAWVSVSSGTQV